MADYTINGTVKLSLDAKGKMKITEPSPGDTYTYDILMPQTFNVDFGGNELIDWSRKNVAQVPLKGPYSGATASGTLELVKSSTETIKALSMFTDQGADASTCTPLLIDKVEFLWYECDGTTLALTITFNNAFVSKQATVRAGNVADSIDFEIKTMTKPTITFA